jgi:ERCC4-type nuclease
MITVDRREVSQHPEIPELLPVSICIDTLEAGDFAFLDRDGQPLGIERCEIGNLIQKLRNGELEQQLAKCSELYVSTIVLVEGIWDSIGGFLAIYKQTDKSYYRVRIYPNTRYSPILAALIRLSELGAEVLQTPNFVCSMLAIGSLYQQRTKPEEQHTLFRKARTLRMPTKLTNNPAVSRLMALCPRMGERAAIRLISRFGSILAVLRADDKELLEVEGVGKGLVKNLREATGN